MLRNQADFDIVTDCAVLKSPRQLRIADLGSGNPCFQNNSPGFPMYHQSSSESDSNKLLQGNTDSGFFSGVVSEELNSNNHIRLPTDYYDHNMKLKSASDYHDSGFDVNSKLADSFNSMTVKNYQNDLSATTLQQKQHKPRQISLEDLVRQDEDGDTPLHLAVLQCYPEVVFRLISIFPHPFLLDIPNKKLQTPLHLAVLVNQPVLVRRLVVAGSSVESRDRNGNTPLHLACREGYLDCARALCFPISQQERDSAMLRHFFPAQLLPQDLEQRNYDGQMCVHLATLRGSLSIVQLLCYAGANVNSVEAKSGRTALHYAVESRQPELVQFLITQCGASVNAENYSGYSAYQIAAATAPRLALMLLNLGAERRPVLESSSSESESDLSDEDLDHLAKWRPNKGQYLQALGEALLMA